MDPRGIATETVSVDPHRGTTLRVVKDGSDLAMGYCVLRCGSRRGASCHDELHISIEYSQSSDVRNIIIMFVGFCSLYLRTSVLT